MFYKTPDCLYKIQHSVYKTFSDRVGGDTEKPRRLSGGADTMVGDILKIHFQKKNKKCAELSFNNSINQLFQNGLNDRNSNGVTYQLSYFLISKSIFSEYGSILHRKTLKTHQFFTA